MRRSSNHGNDHHHEDDADYDMEHSQRAPLKGRHHLTSPGDELRPYPGVRVPVRSAEEQADIDRLLGISG